jgi:hypothetical protein
MGETHGTQGDKTALFWLKEQKERDYLEELDIDPIWYVANKMNLKDVG